MKSRLSHVALLVPSVETSSTILQARGFSPGPPETFESEGTREVYVGSYTEQSGLLLLLQAISAGPYARAMAKRGPSLHHIAIDVLDVLEFSKTVQSIGWQQHSINQQSLEYKTAWFYSKGIPTLLEVHQKMELSEKPLMVSGIELPITPDQLRQFQKIGLEDVVSVRSQICFKIQGQELSFDQIAGRE